MTTVGYKCMFLIREKKPWKRISLPFYIVNMYTTEDATARNWFKRKGSEDRKNQSKNGKKNGKKRVTFCPRFIFQPIPRVMIKGKHSK